MPIPQTNDLPATDARHHALNISRALKDLAHHAREDLAKFHDQRGQGLLETTAEVLLGLARAHDRFVDDHPVMGTSV